MPRIRDNKGKFKYNGGSKKRIRTEYNSRYWKEIRSVGDRKKIYLESKKKSYKKHRDKDMERSKKWVRLNKHKSMAIKKKHTKVKRENQAGRPMSEQCEICGTFDKEMKKRLCFDHCHTTGKFRGWICTRCNLTLGLVKDNTETLHAMIKYLNESTK
jgi:uncharacterized protein (DUF927 family)